MATVPTDSKLLRKKFPDKKLFVSANTNHDYLVSENNCSPLHDHTTCLSTICAFHILIMGDTMEALQKLDSLCFTYQTLDYLYALFKYQFNDKIVTKIREVFEHVQSAVEFDQENRKMDQSPAIAKLKASVKSKKSTG